MHHKDMKRKDGKQETRDEQRKDHGVGKNGSKCLHRLSLSHILGMFRIDLNGRISARNGNRMRWEDGARREVS